ncbi:hypothetical protein C0J52_24297, partial [Blattella germanica]
SSLQSAGSTAEIAAKNKRRKYENLTSNYIFVTFAAETFGPLCKEAKDLLRNSSTGSPPSIHIRRSKMYQLPSTENKSCYPTRECNFYYFSPSNSLDEVFHL